MDFLDKNLLYQPVGQLVEEYRRTLRERSQNPRLAGLPLHVEAVKKALRRLRVGEVTVLGGYEGHGKSCLAQQIALDTCRDFLREGQEKMAVLYVSMEMPREQIISRALVQQGEQVMVNLLEPNLLSPEDWQLVERDLLSLGELPFIICDSVKVTTDDLFQIVGRELRNEFDVRLVVVDYLQLLANLPPQGGGEVQRVDEIMRDLKDLAQRMQCHVLALSSLNRELSEDFLPTSHNLRSSGGIQYMADNITFVQRPRLLDSSIDERWQNVAYYLVRKQRNGAPGSYKMKWNEKRLRFESLPPWEEERLGPLPIRKRSR